jgi:hypothetical protein
VNEYGSLGSISSGIFLTYKYILSIKFKDSVIRPFHSCDAFFFNLAHEQQVVFLTAKTVSLSPVENRFLFTYVGTAQNNVILITEHGLYNCRNHISL